MRTASLSPAQPVAKRRQKGGILNDVAVETSELADLLQLTACNGGWANEVICHLLLESKIRHKSPYADKSLSDPHALPYQDPGVQTAPCLKLSECPITRLLHDPSFLSSCYLNTLFRICGSWSTVPTVKDLS
jgi:hypothetical protein